MAQLQWLAELANKIQMVEETTTGMPRKNSQLLREVIAELDSERETLMRMGDDFELMEGKK